ncbi:MAG TPA: potassium/proton antiporter [Bacteroidales bacterium]|nr:potassium/proton antiporter [Bacteroidales bacterium]HRZ50280.1 potassium/proton antiporter [Bacteroidales bacterium]
MGTQLEVILIGLSVLFFFSILAGKAGSRLGVPALLLFLIVGMLSGDDGLGIRFENIYIAKTISTVALCIILFSGGLDTKAREVVPVLWPGLLLSTLGVFLTALITGLLIWWIFGATPAAGGIGLMSSLLLASIMASTDSASVFSILRNRGLTLRGSLRPLLELESGSNDPMAYMLVITLAEIIKLNTVPNPWSVAGSILLQLVIGGGMGYAFGKLAVFTINFIKIDNTSLYPILVFTFCMFIFSATYFLHGNSYLAVYIGGLVIGNSVFVHKRTSLSFFDGLAWLSQLLMFLTLGLLVNPHELVPLIVPGLIISFLLIFISRPVSVFLCLLPFRNFKLRDKAFISWVGLRGAVPIVFAIIPLADQLPHARLIFNLVFLCTLVSLLVQGTSLSMVAGWLKLYQGPKKLKKAKDFDMLFSEEIKSVTTEIEITATILKRGNLLMDLNLPDQTLAVMVKRNDTYFIPTGKTILQEKDKLLIITDNHDALMETYRQLEGELPA